MNISFTAEEYSAHHCRIINGGKIKILPKKIGDIELLDVDDRAFSIDFSFYVTKINCTIIIEYSHEFHNFTGYNP
jgi:hypothetical protein